ncbi:MAG: hypothetical protein AAGA46_03085, partial [Cyanobacteria bacterium P01_F01_bin.13]
MSTPIPTAQHRTLIQLINETYTDEVEEILQARLEDNGDILATARDEDRIIGFKYTDELIFVRVLNPEVIEELEEDDQPRDDSQYSHINFTPPQSVVNAAKRALSVTESGKLNIGDGMEAATKTWVKRVAKGEAITPAKAKQGYRWFARNARFKDAPKDSPAWAAWAYWFYSEGQSWFNKLWRQMEAAERADDATPTKRVLKWNGFEIGLQYFPYEKRHDRILPAGYGHFRKTRGADGMAVDVYVGGDLNSDKIFVIDQLIDGEFDEEKMVIGVSTMEAAIAIYTAVMPREMLGGVREIALEQLEEYRVGVETKADAVETFQPEPVGISDYTNLESLIEFNWDDVKNIATEQGWIWDEETGRYLSGGEPVDYDDILKIMQAEIARFEAETEEATALLVDGEATLTEWEELIAETVVSAALLFLLLGLGRRPTAEHEARLATELQRQFKYLRNFTQGILSGTMTPAGIAARAKLYIHDAQLAYVLG